jgi:hypothetical protein
MSPAPDTEIPMNEPFAPTTRTPSNDTLLKFPRYSTADPRPLRPKITYTTFDWSGVTLDTATSDTPSPLKSPTLDNDIPVDDVPAPGINTIPSLLSISVTCIVAGNEVRPYSTYTFPLSTALTIKSPRPSPSKSPAELTAHPK